jgi:hypothetical protein
VSLMVDELNVFGSLVGGRMPEYISGPIIFKRMIGGNS